MIEIVGKSSSSYSRRQVDVEGNRLRKKTNMNFNIMIIKDIYSTCDLTGFMTMGNSSS